MSGLSAGYWCDVTLSKLLSVSRHLIAELDFSALPILTFRYYDKSLLVIIPDQINGAMVLVCRLGYYTALDLASTLSAGRLLEA